MNETTPTAATTTTTVMNGSSVASASVSSADDLSFSILWSPLPPITWLFPFIGHMGICDSRGIASDFRGPYFVGDDGRMAFGPPTRALKLSHVGELAGGVQRWDEAIQEANDIYRGRMHNLCCDNCHSHVACALNRMPLQQKNNHHATFSIFKQWNMINLCFLVFFRARFLSWWAVVTQFGPFCVIVAVIILSTRWT